MSLSTLNIFLPFLRVFVYLWVSLSTLNIFLPSLHVFVRLCVSLSTSNVFLQSLRVFVCLCASLPVFACLCVVWVSLRYLDRPIFGTLIIYYFKMKTKLLDCRYDLGVSGQGKTCHTLRYLICDGPAHCFSLFYFLFIIGIAPIYKVMHVRNKNSNIQGKSPSNFPNYKELLIKERVRSLWERILFKKGRN